jgi:uncharacterized protein with HEPN domain
MYDESLLEEKLIQILDALNRIHRRFFGISKPTDFLTNDDNIDKLDSIAMMLIAIGEAFKKIDKETNGNLLDKYPQIDWKGIKGVRDILSHNYFDIDEEEIFKICENDVPILIDIVKEMLDDIKSNKTVI